MPMWPRTFSLTSFGSIRVVTLASAAPCRACGGCTNGLLERRVDDVDEHAVHVGAERRRAGCGRRCRRGERRRAGHHAELGALDGEESLGLVERRRPLGHVLRHEHLLLAIMLALCHLLEQHFVLHLEHRLLLRRRVARHRLRRRHLGAERVDRRRRARTVGSATRSPTTRRPRHRRRSGWWPGRARRSRRRGACRGASTAQSTPTAPRRRAAAGGAAPTELDARRFELLGERRQRAAA